MKQLLHTAGRQPLLHVACLPSPNGDPNDIRVEMKYVHIRRRGDYFSLPPHFGYGTIQYHFSNLIPSNKE